MRKRVELFTQGLYLVAPYIGQALVAMRHVAVEGKDELVAAPRRIALRLCVGRRIFWQLPSSRVNSDGKRMFLEQYSTPKNTVAFQCWKVVILVTLF